MKNRNILKLYGLHLLQKGQKSINNVSDCQFIGSTEEEITNRIIINNEIYCPHLITGQQKWRFSEDDDDVIIVTGRPTDRIIGKFRIINKQGLIEMDKEGLFTCFDEIWKKID